MAVSSSSGVAGKLYRVGLYTQPAGSKPISTANMTLVAFVDVSWPLPPLISYQGNFYVYSSWISSVYVQEQPYVPQPDLGAPPFSVLAFPEF